MFKKILKGIGVVFVVLIIIGAVTGKKDESKDVKTTTEKKIETKADVKKVENKTETKVNYDNFLKINMGAKHDEVVAILGEGKEMSSSEIGGIKTAMYTWSGSGISNMNVTIQNGVVTGRAQAGLKSIDAKVTLDKYNQVKEGMSYEEVKAILGEGILTSQTRIMDMESIMYTWSNKNASSMSATFSSGKMNIKAQFNLK